ncbi:hypothetical protein [Winogradskyella flava]|uniref:Uncharacterized protein n=1 Tax=Winogradskyella flava TaxID=1884876 RepID=A0A842IUQ6_9FLAO|nr:hypothetical protein [Winogradskyella flava]MBC2845087.1 hypothetical protein [Winogradskyella flava]
MTCINISCSKDEDGEEISAHLVGNWSGTYDGDDEGVWSVTVSRSGNVTGTATSLFSSDSADITGTVSDSGTLSATIGNSENREFIGQLEEDNEAMGTWVDTVRDYDGTWVGSKN